MRTLGLIPARIGSTGVPRKNIRMMAGRPLIAHTIEAARSSGLDRVIVSTDSPEIAAVARQCGADVPFLRPAPLASNTAIAMEVVRHCLDWIEGSGERLPDAVAYLQPTSPLRRASHIDAALALIDDSADSVVSVVAVDQHPLYMFRPGHDGRLVPLLDVGKRPERRQDLPPVYATNALVPLSWTRYLRAPGNERALVINLDSFKPLIVEPEVAVDINNERDFRLAEVLLTMNDTPSARSVRA
ncbi:MAG: acylneuraminate cytidylyltransferase family protein [Alphaproteobacteria bacterium]|nr:acylneuraminate cytidylyltransferase family protein [Alphaproteobacteria bacterium]